MGAKYVKTFLSVILIISFICSLSACFKAEYAFLHDESEIASIEIVECGYDWHKETGYENALVLISDTKDFMSKLREVPYRIPLYNGAVGAFNYSDIGIKITYSNGDFEIIDEAIRRTIYEASEGYSFVNVVGSFDSEQYSSLLSEYLEQCNEPKFFLMNGKDEISRIEIVDAYANDESESGYTQDVIAEVRDIPTFLKAFESLTYKYTLSEGASNGQYTKDEHRYAVKISYSNGDYEVIDNEWRDIYISKIDEYVNNAYIGEFDKVEFYNLIEEVIAQNK